VGRLQIELIEFLEQQRATGNDIFFSPMEIYKQAGNISKHRIASSLRKLYAYGFLEVNNSNIWKRKYRLKSKYVNNNTKM